MQASRYIALLDPSDMAEARRLGLTNFSGFVKEQIRKFIADRSANLPKNDSDTATVTSPHEVDK
jgi:hypothetical protein